MKIKIEKNVKNTWHTVYSMVLYNCSKEIAQRKEQQLMSKKHKNKKSSNKMDLRAALLELVIGTLLLIIDKILDWFM